MLAWYRTGCVHLPSFFQFQVVQRTLEDVEVYIVRHGALSTDEETVVKRYMQETLGYPFRISLRLVEEIPRSPTGKFEDFVSHVA